MKLSAIQTNKETVKQLYQLKSDVAGANQYIRNAAIIDDIERKKLELEKRMTTRKSASNIYEYLKRIKLDKEDKAIVDKLLQERAEYRDAQNLVVNAILAIDEKATEKYFIPYQVLQDRYDANIIKLTDSLYDKVDTNQKILNKFVILIVVLTNVLVLSIYLTYKHRPKKEINCKNPDCVI